MLPLFIDWQPSTEAFHLGSFSVRWYSLLWAIGIIGAYLVVRQLYNEQGIDPAVDARGRKTSTGRFDPLIFYCFIGIIVGARLGHCLFYEPDYFLGSVKGVIEMLLPIKFAADSWDWQVTGFMGLASHGGTVGLFLALLLYVHRYKIPFLVVLDNIGIAAPLTACCIRLGNLMNSEIIGRPCDLPWAFIFHTRDAVISPGDFTTYGFSFQPEYVEQLGGCLVPRHPSQLYEALAYLVIFFAGVIIYKREHQRNTLQQLRQRSSDDYAGTSKVGTGFYFGFCLATIFLFRFFVEYLKEVQGGVDDGSTTLDMGQMLSIPFVLTGLFFILFMPGKKKT